METSKVTKVWEEYQNTLEYQKQNEYDTKWVQNIDFVEGRQWGKATDRTKMLPRPVFNIISFINQNKKANVLSSKTKAVYKPVLLNKTITDYEIEEDKSQTECAELFTQFADYTNKKMRIEDLDNQALDDATAIGTYIYHFYWGYDTLEHNPKGRLFGEIIDPLNIGFADPEQQDEQKQDWIIIASRENVDKVKKLAEKNNVSKYDLDLIKGDNEVNNYGIAEQKNDKKITVLTKYYRKNGEVYVTKSTENVIIEQGRSLTPKSSEYKITRYPIAIGNWKSKKKSIYGIGEVEPLIPTQKAINFTIALILLSVQNIGFPKIIVRKETATQTITNEVGEKLIDTTPAGNGFRYLTPPAFSGQPLQIVDSLIANIRTLTGSTEVVTGEIIGNKNMSGTAITALQTQAKVPIEIIQKNFWRTKEKIAKIEEQFFKSYYDEDVHFILNNNGKEEEKIFNGAKYSNIDLETTIDIGSTTMYSESLAIAILEQLKASGDINLETFVELYPDNALPFKEQLKQILKENRLPDEVETVITNNPELYQQVMLLVQNAVQNNLGTQPNIV